MRNGLFHVALLFATLVPATSASALSSDGDRRLVIIEAPGNRLSRSAKEHLRSAIGDVVVRHGIDLVPARPLPEKLQRCELPACLPQIAAASGAALVLRVEASYVKESFKLAIELWNADQGKLLGRDVRDCPICDEQDLWGSAALLVQGMLDRNPRDAKPDPTAPPRNLTPPPTMPATASATTSGKASALPEPAAASATAWPSAGGRNLIGYGGLGLLVLGAGVLETGIYYIAVDGNHACEHCDQVRDTARYGRPLAIAGGAAMVAGAALLLWRFWPSAPAVSVGPSGFSVAGRFE